MGHHMKLVFIAAAWVAGLMIGLEMEVYLPALVLFCLAAAVFAILLKGNGVSAWPALLALVLLMGIIRLEASGGPEPLEPSGPLPITLRGLVVSDPELAGPGVELTLSVESVDRGDGWEEGSGRVLVVARPPRELVEARDAPYFRYGDTLELTGILEKPAKLGDFDYGAYLANQGVHSTMPFPKVRVADSGGGNPAQGLIFDLRREVSQGIDEALPETQASLAQALLLGIRGRLPREVTEDFRSTGTSHLLAISGLHVGILLAMSLGAGAWLMGRRRQVYLLLPLAAIWLYALVSGLSPSVERAAVMGSVYLAALFLGRPRSVLPALALAAGLMAGLEPQVLKQVSFQLSFAAVAGIALLTTSRWPVLSPLSGSPRDEGWKGTLVRALVLAVAVSVAATVATLPLIAFNFQRVPVLGIPATILALPALPIFLVTSALAAGAGLINSSLGQAVGWLAWVPLEYLIQLVHLVAKVPGSTFSVPSFSGLLVWAYYGTLAVLLLVPGGPRTLWVWLDRRLAAIRVPSLTHSVEDDGDVEEGRDQNSAEKGDHDSRAQGPGHDGNDSPDNGIVDADSYERHVNSTPRPAGPAERKYSTAAVSPKSAGLYLASAVGLAVLAILLWLNLLSGPDGRLHVHFLDVSQGDSILIVTPSGRQVLVDGGPGAWGAARAIGDRLSFLDRDLDLVVLTHPDEDHFRGLIDVLERYDVDVVLESGGDSLNPLYVEWDRVLGTETRRVTAVRGQTIVLDGDTWLEVLGPPAQPINGTSSDSNNNGVVLRLVHGKVSFLLTADVEAEAEDVLLRDGLSLQSTVFKVPHHGSKTSTTTRFLREIRPTAAVISAGADNPYGHPHPEVMDRLAVAAGLDNTFLTAERGDIEFTTDGERLWVKTER